MDNYLRANWSLLNPESGEGKGGANTFAVTTPAPPTHPLPVAHGPRFRFSSLRAGPAPLPRAPRKSRPPDSREKKHRLVSRVPLQVPLPFCLATSALGRQHGRCSYLAKRPLISGRGAASLQLQPRFPALSPALSPAPRARPWGWRAHRYMGAGLRARRTASCSEAVWL